MKIKKIAALFAAVCMGGMLCSCMNSRQASESSSKYDRISVSPLDENLLGDWFNGTNGYGFHDNRKLSLIIDFSERGHFTEKGEFQTLNGIVPAEWVTLGGDELTVIRSMTDLATQETTESVVLEMTRKSGGGSGFDGVYDMKSGPIPNVIANELGRAAEDLVFEAEVRGESFIVTVVDCFDYEVMGDSTIDIFSADVEYVDKNARGLSYKYTIDGDTLTMNYTALPDAPAEVYTKVK